jgi:hypothetical protein
MKKIKLTRFLLGLLAGLCLSACVATPYQNMASSGDSQPAASGIVQQDALASTLQIYIYALPDVAAGPSGLTSEEAQKHR